MFSLLRQAWSSWKNAKGVALLAILALAVGIGSATAIYTVVHTVLLKPLPYRDANRLVALYGAINNEPGKKNGLTPEYFEAFQKRQRSFDFLGLFTILGSFNLSSPGEPQHVAGSRVDPELLQSIGAKPVLGRWFGTTSQENGNHHLAVIAYSLWKRLGGQEDIVGKSLVLDGVGYEVTGVAPPWFHFPLFDVVGGPDRNEIWIPLTEDFIKEMGSNGLYMSYGRLKSGLTFHLAAEDVKRVATEIARANPSDWSQKTAFIEPLRQAVGNEIRPTLLLLLAAAALLLLITCANVAGLLVTRAISRNRETAIRLALGAARGQLVFHFLAESLIVSLIGAAASVVLSYLLLRAVIGLIGNYVPFSDQISLDLTALTFAVAAALITSFLTSLAPLWHSLRTPPNAVLTEGVRASGAFRSRRLSQWLVIAEIALAFTLLAISALLIAQIQRLHRVRAGFDAEHLLTFQMTITDPRFSQASKMLAYRAQIQGALRGIAGVTQAGLVTTLPLTGCCSGTALMPEGRTLARDTILSVSLQIVSPGYFATLRIPLLAGRLLTNGDADKDPLHVLINETAAKRYWGTLDATGKFARLGGPNGSRAQIIGVVADVRNDGLNNPPVPEVYMLDVDNVLRFLYGVVRSDLPETTLVPAIRRAVQQVNPAQPVYRFRTMNEVIGDSFTLQRATALLSSFFSGAALLLTALGVYGVIAYSVRQRTVEFGTRMSFGALPKDLLRLVTEGGIKMALAGLVLGVLVVSVTAALLVKSSFIQAVEPLPILFSALTILTVAMIASLYPAWRASQLAPMAAIRDEPETMWLRTREQVRRVAGNLSHLLAREDATADISESTLLGGFVDAARNSQDFASAMHAVLLMLCQTLGSDSALLLEKTTDGRFTSIAGVPGVMPIDAINAHESYLGQRLQFYPSPLPLSDGDYQSWIRWSEEQRPQFLAELSWLSEHKIRLAVPLRTSAELLGLLLLGPRPEDAPYSPEGRRALKVSADRLALMLENGRLAGRVVEQEKLRRDVALAIEVQKRLLPETLPESNFGDVAAFTLPARSVGGDYYDFVKVGDHSLGIALADVAGKGVAAALIMSVVQASLRILSTQGNLSLPELVSKMNQFLHRSTSFNSYATFFYAQLDEQSGQLSYVNAGHNPPYLLRASEVSELSTGGMVIGLLAQAQYEEAKVDLRSGDVLVAFTDGVSEAMNEAEEEFGEERLKELLQASAHLPVNEISARITASLRAWIGAAPQHDDLTFLVLKVK
jgi:predicted permease